MAKNIVLKKKINGVIEDVMPKTVGSVVYVTDPTVDGAAENGAVLNEVLNNLVEEIASIEETGSTESAKAFKKVEYANGVISFYKDEDGTTADATINVPEEQFLDAAQTRFIPNYQYNELEFTEYVGKEGFSTALNGKSLLVLAVKTTASDGTQSVLYSPIDLSAMVDTYTGAAHTTSNPIGISVDEEGVISGSVAIQSANNALKVNASGELYVEDLAIADSTEGGIVVQDADGKMADSGIVLAKTGETLPDDYESVVEAINDLSAEVTFGSDGQIKLELDKTVETNTYDFYFSVDHVDAEKVIFDEADAGKIAIVAEDGSLTVDATKIDDLAKAEEVYTKEEVDEAIGNAIEAIPETDLSEYAKTEDIEEALASKADATDVETLESKINELDTEVELGSSDESLSVEATENGYDFKINLEGLSIADGTPARVGEFEEGTDSIIDALNQVMTIAGTALTGNGATYFVAKNASVPTTISDYDLIMQEI